MSSLTVIRHAQASFFSDDYDQLSPLGREQSRLLGEYLGRQGYEFDEIYTGPRRRQVDTAAIALTAMSHGSHTPPTVIERDDLDEYPGELFHESFVKELARENELLTRLLRAYDEAVGPEVKIRWFQKVFEEILLRWMHGQITCDGRETWPEFDERVQSAYRNILDREERGRRVAVFTSAGPAGIALRLALQLCPETTLRQSWLVRNTGVSQFLFTRNRFSMLFFNATPHLTEPERITYW